MPAAPQRARRIAVCRFIGFLVLVDRARLPQQEQEESSAEQRGDDARADFVGEDEVAAEPVGDEHQRRAVEGGDGQLFFRADRAAAPRQVRGHQADKAERPDGQGGDDTHQRDEDEQQAAATAHGKAEAARDGFAERQQLQRFASEQGGGEQHEGEENEQRCGVLFAEQLVVDGDAAQPDVVVRTPCQ